MNDFEVSPEAIETIRLGLQTGFDGFTAALDRFAQAIAVALSPILEGVAAIVEAFPVRLPGEHPADWVLRVGPEWSGYNIREGERWRYETLALRNAARLVDARRRG